MNNADRLVGIGAYLPDYRISNNNYNINASVPHLTDLILFSIQPNSKGMIISDGSSSCCCCLQKEHYQIGIRAREYHNPNLKLWVTIGGAGRSDEFSSIVANPKSRKRLVGNMVKLSQQYNLYGIDLDTFYPTTQIEYTNYQKFVHQATAASWKKNSNNSYKNNEEDIQKLRISVTWSIQRVPLPKSIYPLIDRVNLIGYDLISRPNMYHATMEMVQKSVETLLSYGCPVEKIWLGIPFYGRGIHDPQQVATFESIYKQFLEEEEEEEEEETKKDRTTTTTTNATTAMSGSSNSNYDFESTNNYNGIEWDSRERIRKKVDYAISKNLGGVYFWELGQDYQDLKRAPGGILLEAASDQLHKYYNNLLKMNTINNNEL